jgi:hypothetical protein
MAVMSDSSPPTLSTSSGVLFIAAKEAAKRAWQSEGTLGEKIEVMTAVMFCAVVAEAGINEISKWFEFHHLRPPFSIPHGLPYGFDRLELRTKWSLLPMIIRQRTFSAGEEPWQSFDAMIELRNYIVHLRRRPLPKAVAALLKAKKLFVAGSHLHFDAARWACETIAQMFETLTELVDPPKEWINLIWCWTPTHSFPYGISTPGDQPAGTEEDNERSTAMGFYHYAQSYREAASLVTNANKPFRTTTHPEAPTRFLYYHAIELYLKAFLRMHGYTPRELATRKFEHDTLRLSKKVASLGIHFDDEDVQVFSLMGKTDAVIRSRYIQTGSFRWPTLDALNRVCERLRRLIGHALRKGGVMVRI